jgi:hypothetical protein
LLECRCGVGQLQWTCAVVLGTREHRSCWRLECELRGLCACADARSGLAAVRCPGMAGRRRDRMIALPIRCHDALMLVARCCLVSIGGIRAGGRHGLRLHCRRHYVPRPVEGQGDAEQQPEQDGKHRGVFYRHPPRRALPVGGFAAGRRPFSIRRTRTLTMQARGNAGRSSAASEILVICLPRGNRAVDAHVGRLRQPLTRKIPPRCGIGVHHAPYPPRTTRQAARPHGHYGEWCDEALTLRKVGR